MDEKKPMDHEDYRIPGTNMFNLSKWIRENDPPQPGKYKIGDHVSLVLSCVITRVFQDCDGTTLYSLEMTDIDQQFHGYSDDNLLPGQEDDWKHSAVDIVKRGLDNCGDGQ